MSDFADRSAAAGELYLKAAIAKAAGPIDQGSVEDNQNCQHCGDEIPEGRRRAVPGCKLCVTCQQEKESPRS